jgi:hypothetical protein
MGKAGAYDEKERLAAVRAEFTLPYGAFRAFIL